MIRTRTAQVSAAVATLALSLGVLLSAAAPSSAVATVRAVSAPVAQAATPDTATWG
ncbi:hypothetical protein ACIPPM_16060 [Streptomyces sp. NPDC090119]|uniref:hypothetical protein n=1 Tax=Streptomyces sp. NPDC090119 TaxID=3365951 RepID=UPI00381F2CF3